MDFEYIQAAIWRLQALWAWDESLDTFPTAAGYAAVWPPQED